MDGEKTAMENSSCSNKFVAPSSSAAATTGGTIFTTETLRLELRDGEKPNILQDVSSSQANLLVNQAMQKKKTPQFHITSVVFNACAGDAGEESPDETEDVSEILDSSKFTSDIEQETPTSISEECSKSEDVCAPGAVIPTSSQYGITAVVQQNESGGLLTSRLPQGITVNVTKGGIALAEADGVTSDADKISNRFKIVKIASNKPLKKGRWVCFDFMDSPATSTVGVRNTDTAQGVSIPQQGNAPLQSIIAESQEQQTSQHQGQAQQSSQVQQTLQHQNVPMQQQQSQYSVASQSSTSQQGSIPFSSQMNQGYHGGSNAPTGNMPSHGQQVPPHMSLQQQQIQQQLQMQQHMQQQNQSTAAITSQVLDNQQKVGTIGQQQPSIGTDLNQASPITQGVAAVSIIQQQQMQSQPKDPMHQQGPSQIQQQMHPASIASSHIPAGQQMTPQTPQQQIQQPSHPQQQQQFQQQQIQQPSTQNQQQMQHQMQQQPLQQQQSLPSQPLSTAQITSNQEQQQIQMKTDNSPSSQVPNSSYQPPTQTPVQQSATQVQQNQSTNQQQTSSNVAQVALAATSGQATSISNISNYPSASGLPSISNLSNLNITNLINGQINATNLTQLVGSDASAAGSAVPTTSATESSEEQTADDGAGAPDDDKPSASTASTVAIDNKIEQAMDLVKSHLMFAVREEVDVLKEKIGELMERINHLEYENTVLKKYATQDTLQQLQHNAPNP